MLRNELINARETLRLTQAMVAESVSISRSFYGLIESGNRNPCYGLALKIATKVKKMLMIFFLTLTASK